MKISTKKKHIQVLVVSVIAACVLAGCLFTEQVLPLKTEKLDVDAVVEVNANIVMEKNFLGVGVQWSSYPWWDISDADWEKLFRRVEYMKLPFARVMIDAFWYCQGFDSFGKPIYTWDTSYMKKLYRLLDWCQANNTTVMFGEWGKPEGSDLTLKTEDPAWTKIIGDCMVHLLEEKGYTCIKYYNLINEPHGWWTEPHGWWTYLTFEQWRTAIDNLHKEFVKRGIRNKLMIAAPDASRMWTTKVLNDKQLNAQTDIYDEHWYLQKREITSGAVERYTRDQVRQIQRKDPGSQYFLGEIGILDGRNDQDQQREVYKFWYGVSMADAAIQCIRGGMSGFKAWDLDDAMHFYGDGGEAMNALSDKLPDNAYEVRKIWGFWNIVAAEQGNNPEDEYMRPWFYTWSLLGRSFPAGCETLDVDDSGVYNLRVAAARIPDQWGKYHLSFAVVNNSDDKRKVHIVVPKAGQNVTLARFDYFDADNDNKVDAWPEVVDNAGNDIFPSPTRTMRNIDLTEGLTVSLPTKGVVILTTLEKGNAIPLKW